MTRGGRAASLLPGRDCITGGCPNRAAPGRSRCPRCERQRRHAYDNPRYRTARALAKGQRCGYPGCALPITPQNPMTVHHVVRVADGGADGPLMPMCWTHNRLLG